MKVFQSLYPAVNSSRLTFFLRLIRKIRFVNSEIDLTTDFKTDVLFLINGGRVCIRFKWMV